MNKTMIVYSIWDAIYTAEADVALNKDPKKTLEYVIAHLKELSRHIVEDIPITLPE